MKNRLIAYINLTLAMFIAGSSVVASKLLVQTLPVFLASELSLITALVILIPLTYLIKRDIPKLNKKTIEILFFQAMAGVFLFRVLLFYGLKYTSAIESGLITSASPAMVSLLAVLFLKEKIYINRLIGIIFVVSGILIINIYNAFSLPLLNLGNSAKGNVLILLAITCEALFSVLSKKNTIPIPPIYRTTIITTFSIFLFLPFSIFDILHYNFSYVSNTAYLSVLYYGVFVSVISYILWFKGIAKVPASNAAVFTAVMPISSIFLSNFILSEKILLMHIVSLFSIILGIHISCSSNIKNIFLRKMNDINDSIGD